MPILLLLYTLVFSSPSDLKQLRDLFPLIGINESSNKKMLEVAKKNNALPESVKMAYAASACMASAKFKTFPLAKYQAFAEGKKMLEESIVMDKQNPEIRFVRYVIQSELPAFLLYNQNTNEDKIFLLKSLPALKSSDPDLFSRIATYLKI